MARSNRVTIGDVAEQAGVSIATVSRVLNGLDTVNETMVSRVLAAAAALGYRPNAAARGLASGAYRTVGVVVPDLGNPYFTDILHVIVAQAKTDDHRVVVADSGGDGEEEFDSCLQLLPSVDGLVLVSPRMPAASLRLLSERPVPLVLVNRHEEGFATVLSDTREATNQLCRHLTGLGHRRIVYLSGSSPTWQGTERLRGVEDARRLGVTVEVVTAGSTIESGYRAAPEALRHQPTAIMAFNDLSAFGVITRLREEGLEVPGDVSVTGFDDIEIAGYIRPSLTTAVSPKTRLGELAWQAVAAAMRGEQREAGELVASPLVVRESTGPAPVG